MTKGKSLSDRLADDIMTDNTKINSYAQCRDCMYRGLEINGEWISDGDRAYCKVFRKEDGMSKPNGLYDGTVKCEFRDKE